MTKKISLILLTGVALLNLVPTLLAAQTKEYRMMWVSRYEWPSANQTTAKNNINNIMTTLKNNNFNAVLFQVRGQADTHYPSTIDPWTNTYDWKSPGWDPLAYALQSAKSNGLEFHAYFNTHVMISSTPPSSTTPQHIYNTHGPNSAANDDWRIHDESGTPVEGTDGYVWMSPGHPEASLHTRKAVMELVTNYAVDGVHFDRIRCPSDIYSHDPVSEARFLGEGNPDGLVWGDFMRRQITDDLRRIYGQVAMVRPSVKLSAAPFGIIMKTATTQYQGTGTQAYYSWFQDGWRWMKEGCVDFMVPQIYWEVGSSHPFEKLLADWQTNRGERIVVGGSTTLGGSKTSAALQAELAQTRAQNAGGWCSFSYGGMGNYWSNIKNNYYTSTAAVPDMPWKTSPTKGIITGFIKDASGAPVTDAKVVLAADTLKNANGTAPYNHLTGADGFFAILNVAPGTAHQLSITKSGKKMITKTGVSVTAGNVTQVNAAFESGTVVDPAETVIVECRIAGGSRPNTYSETASNTGATFADTSAKSSAAGLTGTGGRYIGTDGLGAAGSFTPANLGAGAYNVYVTLSLGTNNVSPGAGWTLTSNGSAIASGTVNLSYTNTAVVNNWYRLCGPVELPAGSSTTLKIVNNNTASASSGGRFVMDAVKFEAVRSADVNGWELY